MGSGLGLTRSTWRTARSSTSRRVAFSLLSTPGVRAPALTGRKPNWASPLPRRLECARAESPPAARLKRTVTVSKTVRVLDPPRSTLGLTALPRRRTYATRVLRVHLSRVGSARVTSGAVNGGGARVKCACRFYSSRPIRDSSRWVLPADLRTTPTTPTDPATTSTSTSMGRSATGSNTTSAVAGSWRMTSWPRYVRRTRAVSPPRCSLPKGR